MNVLGVQAMFIISISLNILLVLGADDHNDEHWFLQNDLIVSCCRRPRLQVKSYSAQTQSSLTSLRYLSIHLVMPILRSGLSNMSICKERDRVKGGCLESHSETKVVETWKNSLLVQIPDQSEIWQKEAFLQLCPQNMWWKHCLSTKSQYNNFDQTYSIL